MIVDCHCHVIPAALLGGKVPSDWQPEFARADGRPVVSFQGRRLTSVTSEFCDVTVILEQAAAAGVTHLLLSPWILLVPLEADPATATRVRRLLNDSLAQTVADHAGRVVALGAVPLQDTAACVAELEYLMSLPGVRGVEVPASVGGSYLGATSRPFDMGSDRPADEIRSLGLDQ